MSTQISCTDRLEAIKVFMSNKNIDQFPQAEIRSAIWHLLDTKDVSVVTGLMGGVDDAIQKGYKL